MEKKVRTNVSQNNSAQKNNTAERQNKKVIYFGHITGYNNLLTTIMRGRAERKE